jgi:hypothetical protein
MTETQPLEAQPLAEPAPAPAAPSVDEQPNGEERVEHARNSIVHSVENVVGKISGTLRGFGGRK